MLRGIELTDTNRSKVYSHENEIRKEIENAITKQKDFRFSNCYPVFRESPEGIR